MIIQPRGYTRERSYSALMTEIKHRIKTIAARHDVSKSFVIATILADAVGVKEQPKYYEINQTNKRRNTRRRNSSKARNFKPRKKHSNKAA